MTEIRNKYYKIQDLEIGDWFMLDNGDEFRNKYKFVGESGFMLFRGECSDLFDDFLYDTDVEKIDGLSLYLLQGGRDWD